MKKTFGKVLMALSPLLALVTYSGTLVELENQDLSTMGSAVGGFAQTALSLFIDVLPYMALMVVVFFVVRSIPKWLKLWGRKGR